jgi:subtilisin-like proprotein convertase family protein
VTVTVAVPVGGASSDHISIRVCVPCPFRAPTRVRLCAPYVTLETAAPGLLDTPTISSRFGAEPTV